MQEINNIHLMTNALEYDPSFGCGLHNVNLKFFNETYILPTQSNKLFQVNNVCVYV